MPFQDASEEHGLFYQELIALIDKHSSTLKPIEILALAANMLGKLIALQNTSPDEAMETCMHNMERGNAEVVEQFKKTQGTA